MNQVFVDVNVLLETLLPNRIFAEQAEAATAGKSIVISPLSVHLFVHFGAKEGFALADLLEVISNYSFTTFGADEIDWAVNNCVDNDFEDALQVACALLHGCKSFVTFDKALAKRYGQHIDMHVLGRS